MSTSPNLRPKKLYCSVCKELIHQEPFQTYRSNADFSEASHSTMAGCDDSRRMARAAEYWIKLGEEPDIVY